MKLILSIFLFLSSACKKVDKSNYESVFEDSSSLIINRELSLKYVEFPDQANSINKDSLLSADYINTNHSYNGKWPLEFENFSNFKIHLYQERELYSKSSPIVIDKKIIVNQDNGVLKCFDIVNGKTIWSYDIKKRFLEKFDQFYMNSRLVLKDGKDFLILNSNLGNIALIDIKNGHEIWNKKYKMIISDSSSECDSESCYFLSADGSVFAIDILSGDLKWSYSEGDEGISYLYFGSKRFLLDKENLIYSNNRGDIIFLNKRNGKFIHKSSFSYFSQKDTDLKAFNSIARSGDILIGSSEILNISFGIDLKSRDIKWIAPFGISTKFLMLNEFAIGVSSENYLICFDISTGHIKWIKSLEFRKKYELPKYLNNGKDLSLNIVYDAPILINGEIVLTNYFGEFYRFDLQTGDLISRQEIPNFISGGLILFEDKIYAQTILGKLYRSR